MASVNDGVWVGAGAGAPVSYPAAGLALMAAIEDQSAWYAERNRLIATALRRDAGLPAHFVEVGAGNGAVSAHLRQSGVDAVAIEPDRQAAAVAAGRGVPTVCGMLGDLGLPPASIESAGVFDVLEHLADPAPLLAELHRVVAPGGRLAVTVPALPALWSQADVLAGHHRRYRRRALMADLEAAGFVAGSCTHAFGVLVPVVGALRALPFRLGRRRSDEDEAAVGTRQVAGYSGAGRAIARVAFQAESRLRRVVPVPVGTSLVAVVHRS